MKALTLKQPFAWAITHASEESDAQDLRRLGVDVPDKQDLTLGAVVAVVRVAGVATWDPGGRHSRWWLGPIGWLLDDVHQLPTPVPCRGYQGLWPLPLEVEEWVMEEWGKSTDSTPVC